MLKKTGMLISALTALMVLLSPLANAGEFTLTSPAIASGSTLSNTYLFHGFGCTGENKSPELHWTAGPAGTKSYAVTVYDPDAPTGSGWWHWLVYNLPVDTRTLAFDAGQTGGAMLPNGAEHGRSDFGTYGFGGACPPPGDKPHRYVFTVYALGVDKIDPPEGATSALIGYMINANNLASASLTAYYGR